MILYQFSKSKNKTMKVLCGLTLTFLCYGCFAQGLILDDESYKVLKPDTLRVTPEEIKLPQAYSLLSHLGHVGQQKHNTCGPHSYAHLYGIRYNLIVNLEQEEMSIPPKKSFSASFIANSLNVCDTGITFQSLFDYGKQYGTCELRLFANYPSCSRKPQEKAFKNAGYYKLSDYKKVLDKENDKDGELFKIKKYLQAGFPVIIGLTITENFKDCEGCEFWRPKGELIRNGRGKPAGHAVVVVGYNGNKDQGYFELLNSYGECWGINGIIKIAYDDFWIHAKEAYIVYLNCSN